MKRITINAALQLLVAELKKVGVSRRCGVLALDCYFFPILQNQFQQLEEGQDLWDEAEHFMDGWNFDGDFSWSDYELVLIRVFLDDPGSGHCAMLVCDRRQNKDGVFIYFDSLYSLSRELLSFETMQAMMAKTPLCGPNSEWVHATCPVQGLGTNDCGIWAYLFAALYVKQATNPVGEDSSVGEFNTVQVEVKGGLNSSLVGRNGRAKIFAALKHGTFPLKSNTALEGLEIKFL